MNNNLKITCPKCRATFDAGDAFNAHFEKAQSEAKKQAEKEAISNFNSGLIGEIAKQKVFKDTSKILSIVNDAIHSGINGIFGKEENEH